ncbi:hypothetical protein DFJ77DRAFT_465107 [Powellomyces hirtus]|nr:hypothetical protein DFJ77DRAFT_465107 [Powellomyces hirtus]
MDLFKTHPPHEHDRVLFCPGPIFFSEFHVVSPCFLRTFIPFALLSYVAVTWAVRFLVGRFDAHRRGASADGYVRLEQEEYAGETQHLLSEDVEETLPARIARNLVSKIPDPTHALDKAPKEVKWIIYILCAEFVAIVTLYWFKWDEKELETQRLYPFYVALSAMTILPWALHAHIIAQAQKGQPLSLVLKQGGPASVQIKGFWLLALMLTIVELIHFVKFRKHSDKIGTDSPYAWAAPIVISPLARLPFLTMLVLNTLYIELRASKPEYQPEVDIETGLPGSEAPTRYEHDHARRQQVLSADFPIQPAAGADRDISVVVDKSPTRGTSLQAEFDSLLAATRAAAPQVQIGFVNGSAADATQDRGLPKTTAGASGGNANKDQALSTTSDKKAEKKADGGVASKERALPGTDAPKKVEASVPKPAAAKSAQQEPSVPAEKPITREIDPSAAAYASGKPSAPAQSKSVSPEQPVKQDFTPFEAPELKSQEAERPASASAVPELPKPTVHGKPKESSTVPGISADAEKAKIEAVKKEDPPAPRPETQKPPVPVEDSTVPTPSPAPLRRTLQTAASTDSILTTGSSNNAGTGDDDDDEEEEGAEKPASNGDDKKKKKKKNKKKGSKKSKK